MNTTSLRQSIIQTLSYFDMFDMPLTREELYRWLWQPPAVSYQEFVVFLDIHDTGMPWAYVQGHYVLKKRESLIEKKQEGGHIVHTKLQIAKKAAKKLRWIPFVRACCVCNTVAGGGVKPDSDIDVFLIIQERRLWVTRLLVTLVLSLFFLRRTKTRVTNKICLSFYVTTNQQCLCHVRMPEPDIYFAYWMHHLIPVYDPDHSLGVLMEKNTWLQEYLPHASLAHAPQSSVQIHHTRISQKVQQVFEYFFGGKRGDFFEKKTKAVQLKKMQHNTTSLQHAGDTRVMISDSILKFHENDRRMYYRDLWQERWNKRV
ncbi:MAG: hypothetical protein KBD15_00755 [Candidatus Magasanikbacteria bacterium]|nr:hypothetical protein [Candidatus Magasanikbacteria bacterium]